MKAVRVQYTVTEDYAPTNKANIEKVMADLKELANPGIRYSAFTMEDGCTFVHFAMFDSAESQGELGKLESFGSFQKQLRASGLVSPPDAQPLGLVGASWDILRSSTHDRCRRSRACSTCCGSSPIVPSPRCAAYVPRTRCTSARRNSSAWSTARWTPLSS